MKGTFLFILRTGISGLLIWFVLTKITASSIIAHFQRASFPFLILAITLFLISNFLGVFQWKFLLQAQKIYLPIKNIISLYFIGLFFNNFTVGNMGGDALRVYYTAKECQNGSAAFTATFLDKFVGFSCLTIFSLISYFFSPKFESSSSIFALILAVVSLVILIVILVFSRRLGDTIGRILLKLVPGKVKLQAKKVREGLILYRFRKSLLARVLLIAFCIQFLRISVHYTLGFSLGIDPGFGYFLIFIPLIAIVASVPVSFGGIGLRENFGILLFKRLGIAGSATFSMEFLAYLTSLIASLPGGVLFVLRKTGGK